MIEYNCHICTVFLPVSYTHLDVYKRQVECMLNGEEIPVDWCQGHSENAVYLTELNSAAIAEGTEEKVEEVWAAIDSGELKVFDTSTWTVGGETITSTKDLEGFNGIEYISPDGYFMESEICLLYTSRCV